MNVSHSGNGTVKSEARKRRLKSYRDSGTRERNRDRRMARIIRGFPEPHRAIQRDGIWHILRVEA